MRILLKLIQVENQKYDNGGKYSYSYQFRFVLGKRKIISHNSDRNEKLPKKPFCNSAYIRLL